MIIRLSLLAIAVLVLPSLAVAGKKDDQQQPALMVDQSAYDFGTVPIGATGNHDFRLENAGAADLHLFSVTREGSSAFFTVDPGDCPDRLAPKESCRVQVAFAPLAAGSWDAQMVIRSDDPEHPALALPLTGATAVSGTSAITLQPPGVDFGRITVGDTAERQMEITNQGTGDLMVLRVAETDSLQPPFSLVENGCAGSRLQAGDSCFLTVHFAPSTGGSFQDTFAIVSDDPQNPVLTAEVSRRGRVGASASDQSLAAGGRVPRNYR